MCRVDFIWPRTAGPARVAVLACLVGTLSLMRTAAGQPAGSAPHPDETSIHAMTESGVVVGNVLFGPTDGIFRYAGDGRFLDVVVPLGTQGLDVPCCVAFGPDDHLYVSHPFGSSVLRFDGLTGAFIDTFVAPGSGGLVIPLSLVFHDGSLYVGDPGAHAIRRYDAATGAFIETLVQDDPADPQMAGFDPQHFAFGPDGNLYVGTETSNRVLRYDATTGTFVDRFVSETAGLVSPGAVNFGPDGLLYVGSFGNSDVRRYDVRDGTSEVFVPAGSGGLNGPVRLEFGPDGHMYVTSLGTASVLGYDGRTGAFRGALVESGAGGLTGPRILAINPTVTLCHVPPGNPSRAKTLTVTYMSGLDHSSHGDRLGACP